MEAPKRIWCDDLALALIAGWVNCPVEKMPKEMRAHTCEATAIAWGRVADAARSHLASEHARIVAEKDARIAEIEERLENAYTRGFHDGQELVDKEVFEIVNSPDMRERDARIAELRGLLWYAWHEFNAIRARDGAPKAADWNDPKLVDEAYWSQLTDAFAAAIGEDATTPWPSPEARAALKGDDNG